MTMAVNMGLLALFGIAWVVRGGCDRILAVLAWGFVIAVACGQFLHGMERNVAQWLIDCAVVAAMTRLWTAKDDMRAYSIGLLGLGMIGWRLAYASGLDVSHVAFAVTNNVALALQILAAGGILDGLGYWLDDRIRVLFPRRHRLLRNVEGA